MATMAMRVSHVTVEVLLVLLIATTQAPNCQLQAAEQANERHMVKVPILGEDIERHTLVNPAREKVEPEVEEQPTSKPTRRTLDVEVLNAHQPDGWHGRGPGNPGRGRDPGHGRGGPGRGGPGRGGPGHGRGGPGWGPGGGPGGGPGRGGPGHGRGPHAGRHLRSRQGFPHAGASDVTVGGSVFCARCSEVDYIPMFGTEMVLLCPHPPPGSDSHPARGPFLSVSSTLTAKDGSFKFSVNSTVGRILDRCLVSIVPGSDSQCDFAARSGGSIPMSALEMSSRRVSDAEEIIYTLPSLSVRSSELLISCSASATSNARRNLLNSQLDRTSNTDHYRRDENDQTTGTFHHQKSSHKSRFIGIEHPEKARSAAAMKPSSIPKVSNRRLSAMDVARSITKRLSLLTINVPPIPAIPPIPPIPAIPPIPQIPPIPNIPPIPKVPSSSDP